MAGVAGEVALARDQVAGAPGQVAQRAGQLVDLAAAFARYALRRDGLHVQVARNPSRDLPRPPGSRRSAERRVGSESIITCRSRWSPSLQKKKLTQTTQKM